MNWHLVANVCELSEPDSFIRAPLFGGLMVSNFDGELIAWDGACPHRGAAIHHGHVAGCSKPVCQYHGRTVRPSQIRRRYNVTVDDGWVWVSMSNGEFIPQLAAEFVDMPALSLWHRRDYVYPCHWTVAIENALEAEHVPFVHEHSLATLGLVSVGIDCWDDGSIERFISSKGGRLKKLADLFPERKSFDYAHQHLIPFACLSSTKGLTYSLQTYYPRKDGQTDFTHRLYATRSSADVSWYFDSVAQINDKVFEEDAAVCASVPAYDGGELSPVERRIAHFRKNPWYVFASTK
jgi:phenylpropionate dioxygenase-like ring-hydroxylating dioxygenase large terminal subunit